MDIYVSRLLLFIMPTCVNYKLYYFSHFSFDSNYLDFNKRYNYLFFEGNKNYIYEFFYFKL